MASELTDERIGRLNNLFTGLFDLNNVAVPQLPGAKPLETCYTSPCAVHSYVLLPVPIIVETAIPSQDAKPFLGDISRACPFIEQ